MNNAQSVLVFGATGQQGGSVARALLHRGWRVRALVRDPFSAGAAALAARGAELVVGTFEDRAAMRSAMAGVDGVFSVQPSSPGGTVTDEQEVGYGITIADLAVECGVKHLVYSSGSATGETPTGVAHYDTKAEIERHIRRLPLAATIVRPATFMELLVMPGFLHKLTRLVDDGRLAGHADLDALRQLHPQLHTFAGWLAGPGRPAFERALTSGARWAFDR